MTTTITAPPPAPSSRPRSRTRGDRPRANRAPREGGMATLLLSPTFIVLALVIAYPLLSAVYQSLFAAESGLDANGFVVEGESFVGLGNYIGIFTGSDSARFYNALWNTTFFTFVSVGLETIIGVAFAVAMNRAFRGRGFLRAAILIPWAIPTAVSGLLWRWIFQSNGIANELLGQQILWTAEGFASQVALIIAEVWKTAPFIGLLVLAGMQLVPEEVYEAAKLDGASAWKQFWAITLPLVRPALLVAVLFRLLDSLRMFDLPFVLIGPRKSSVETLSILAWDESNQLQYGTASAFAIILLAYVGLIAFVFIRLLGADVVGDADKNTEKHARKAARGNRAERAVRSSRAVRAGHASRASSDTSGSQRDQTPTDSRKEAAR